jgi:thiol-disulfide isomerase/thioredoxin
MRKYISLAVVTLVFALTGTAQTQYEVSRDAKNGEKVLKGIISRDILQTDTAFSWYADNLKGYKAYPAALEGLQKNKDSIQLLVFMGTWCDDSHFIIPKFYTLADEAQVAPDHITLVAVDRQKKTLGHLSEAMHITNVPTIIVMQDGKELGRVIEYGKTGLFDMDLGEILKSAKK